MTLTTGQVLQNRYRIMSMLGQGGMGAVYRAWDARLNVPVALKEMIPQPGIDPAMLHQLRHQFQQEAQILARLKHPHLVRVGDFFEEGGNAYLVMDFVEGESLAERIQRDGALPEEQVLTWSQQLLDALAYCHAQGIIHRDVKPHNVIIRSDGRAVLVDFGLVKLWNPNDPRTRTAMRGMGTPEYAPPEQYDAQVGHTDPRSDVYSLGATLYQALTGQAPPTATMRIASPARFQPPRALNPNISPTTEAAVLRATELAVEERFATAQEMAAALRGEVPAVSRPAAPTREPTARMPGARPAAPARRKRTPAWVWALGGLAALVLVAGLAGTALILGSGKEGPSPTPPAEETPAAAIAAGTENTGTPLASPSPTSAPTEAPARTREATATPTRTPTQTTGGTETPGPAPTAETSPTPTKPSGTEAPTSTPEPTSAPSSGALIDFEQWANWHRGDQPYGELTQTQEQVKSGSRAAKLRYDFPASDDDYVVFVRQISLAGQPNSVGAWVYGDGSGHYLNVWIQDAQDEIWSVHLGRVGSAGWKQMAGTLDSSLSWPAGHVSGPDNGTVDYPVRFHALVLDRPGSGGRSGQIYIDDISVWRGQASAAPTPTTGATATPAAGGATPVPSPSPTSAPRTSSQVGRILYTIDAGGSYYLASTDPSWSQGQLIDPIAYDRSTCAGGATATTLAGQSFNLFYGYRCAVLAPQECTSPDGAYKVVIWQDSGGYSLSVYRTSDNEMVQSTYTGPVNTKVPILWAPDSSRFYFSIKDTLHQATPYSAGYQAVLPNALEPYLSPDGSMILYIQPVGSAGAYDVLVANADGSNPHNVTNAAETYKLCARWGR